MSHSFSGLPPLDLEPFDPTPLWDATNNPRRIEESTGTASRRSLVRAGLLSVMAIAATVAGIFLLG